MLDSKVQKMFSKFFFGNSLTVFIFLVRQVNKYTKNNQIKKNEDIRMYTCFVGDSFFHFIFFNSLLLSFLWGVHLAG